MFELLHLLLWIFRRPVARQADVLVRRHDEILHPLRSGPEFEFEPKLEERVMAAVDVAVRKYVSNPETSAVTDYAFYGPTDGRLAVYVEMESTNVVGDRVRNYFVVSMDDRGVIDGCLNFDHDPRGGGGGA